MGLIFCVESLGELSRGSGADSSAGFKSSLIGEEQIHFEYETGAYLGDPALFGGYNPVLLKKGTQFRGESIDLKLGGSLPAGLSSETLRFSLLSDAVGYISKNRYTGSFDSPQTVSFILDLAVSADDERVNALIAQELLGVQVSGQNRVSLRKESAPNTPILASVETHGSEVFIRPESELDASTRYIVMASSGLEDLTGNVSADEFEMSFKKIQSSQFYSVAPRLNSGCRLLELARIGLSALCITLALSSPLMAEQLSWYVSAGFAQMNLDSSSDEIVLSDLGDVSKLALEAGPIAGSGVTVAGDGQPRLTFGYGFRSIPRLSIETVIAPPFVLDLELTGTIRDESIAPLALGTLETGIPAFGSELASIKALPAVLTLVYSFNPEGRFRPCIGAGLMAIYTFDHKIENKELLREGTPQMSVDLAIGPIFQLGGIGRLTGAFSVVAEVKRGSGLGIEDRMKNITLLSQNFSDVVGPATVGRGRTLVRRGRYRFECIGSLRSLSRL